MAKKFNFDFSSLGTSGMAKKRYMGVIGVKEHEYGLSFRVARLQVVGMKLTFSRNLAN
jgi:hypothetical protein